MKHHTVRREGEFRRCSEIGGQHPPDQSGPKSVSRRQGNDGSSCFTSFELQGSLVALGNYLPGDLDAPIRKAESAVLGSIGGQFMKRQR
jgi:hypothetical protein